MGQAGETSRRGQLTATLRRTEGREGVEEASDSMSGKTTQRKKKAGGAEKQANSQDKPLDLIGQLLDDLSNNNVVVHGKENTSSGGTGERELVPFFGDSSGEKGKKRNSKKKDKDQHNSSETEKTGKKKDKSKKKDSSEQDGGRRPSLWAGSAFLNSPPPEDLPMPSAALLAKVSVQSQMKKRDNSTEELKKMLN